MTTEDKVSPTEKGKTVRLVVGSAEEAVHLIRDKLGDRARVISVKQIDGKGLAKFLTSPRLEVIVTIPEEESVDSSEAPEAPALTQNAVTPPSNNNSRPQQSFPNSPIPESEVKKTSLIALMKNAGFDRRLLNRLEGHPRWSYIKELPVPNALSEIFHFLKDEYGKIPKKEIGKKVAFIGTSASGKTTTLCKMLAHEVFFQSKKAHVLKLENGSPNADEALRVFCEVMGVGFHRHGDDLNEISETDTVFMDTPGLPVRNEEEWKSLGEQMDRLGVDTRILVINGAYDADIINRTLQAGDHCGITHLIFTHTDELENTTKLWSFILSSGLGTTLISHGQSVTSDYTEDALSYLLANTFPRHLLK